MTLEEKRMKYLKSKIFKIAKSENGSTVVIVALSFTLLLMVTAVVIDLGTAYSRTAELQNASDSASLAAAQLLPVGTEDIFGILEIKDVAVVYAKKNGIENVSHDNVILGDVINGVYTSVSVVLNQRIDTKLSNFIGLDFLDLSRDSKAIIAPTERVYGAVPFAVRKNVIEGHIENGVTTNIALKFGGGSGTKGDYGVIDLDGVQGGGANDVEMWLNFGYTSQLIAGEDLYPIEPGNMSGPINKAVQNRYDQCTHFPDEGGCNVHQFVPGCPRVMTVPVVEDVDKKKVKIVGFAAFVLEPIFDKDFVYGSFIKINTGGVASDLIQVGDDLDYGFYNVILVK